MLDPKVGVYAAGGGGQGISVGPENQVDFIASRPLRLIQRAFKGELDDVEGVLPKSTP